MPDFTFAPRLSGPILRRFVKHEPISPERSISHFPLIGPEVPSDVTRFSQETEFYWVPPSLATGQWTPSTPVRYAGAAEEVTPGCLG